MCLVHFHLCFPLPLCKSSEIVKLSCLDGVDLRRELVSLLDTDRPRLSGSHSLSGLAEATVRISMCLAYSVCELWALSDTSDGSDPP